MKLILNNQITKIVILILFLFSNSLLGQKTVLKTINHANNKSKEVFHVSMNDESIKIGPYRYQDSIGNILLSGSYWMNQKDSIWTGFAPDGKTIQYRGAYKRGMPVDEWKYFNAGKLAMVYDFSKNELVSFNSNDSLISAFSINVNGQDTIKTPIDHPAMYIGGDYYLLEYLKTNIEYPFYARENNIQGNIYIGFTVDSTGTAINHRVLREIGGGCDQEAMLVVRETTNNWIPAISNGKPVNSYLTVPVSFRLAK